MSDFKASDPKLAKLAIQKLRTASEKLPSETADGGLVHILKEVKSANETISKCEKSYQEQAELLNLTISHSISSYVDRQLATLEKELRTPSPCNPADSTSVKESTERLRAAKMKLCEVYDLTSRWGWTSLKRSQMERIAELYEKINDNALKISEVFKQMAVYAPPLEKSVLAEQALAFLEIIQLGSERINPDKIFSDAN